MFSIVHSHPCPCSGAGHGAGPWVSTSWPTVLTSRPGSECISQRSGGRGLGWLAAVVQPRVDTQVVMANLALINSLMDDTMGF